MPDIKISQLPAGTANADAVVPATNAAGTTTEKVTIGEIAALGGGPPAAHASTHRTGQADAIAPVVEAVTLTGSATILNVGPCDIVRISSSTAVDIRTMGADGEPWLRNGEERLIVNANASGGANITLKHEFTGAGSAANRFRSATAADVVLPAGGSVAVVYSTEVSRWLVLSDARTPTSHTHGNVTNAGAIGSTSGLPIVTGSGGVLQAGAFGTTAGTVCQGNDSRLSDARTPTAHASTHQTGGADAINPVIVTPASLSGSQNNYDPGSCDIVRLSSSTAVDITGIVAPSVDGAMRLIINVNAGGGSAITLKHESASSTAGNRFRNTIAGDFVLPADGGSAVLTYSTAISRWRIL